MASRRMFSIEFLTGDAFLDLKLKSQMLYIYLNLNADDDGIVSNAKAVLKSIGATEKHLRELIEKDFLIEFPEGLIVIKHWKIHNLIQKDRYKETNYKEILLNLTEKNNKIYEKIDFKKIEKSKQLGSFQPVDLSCFGYTGKVSIG